MPFEPGALIGGKYRVVALIGMGGVGRVYVARHIELDTEVAMKVLRPEMAERPDAVQRFAREARASVRLRSERIAHVFDVGIHEGTPYFVMEYMIGCDLLELKQQGSVDVPTLCELFIQACEGLAEAHAQGVVHRDIKPENLFVVRDANGWRSLKLFDFGISKFSLTGKSSDVDLTSARTELMMGTPYYISPEQIRSTRDVDHRTDIWSLGVVMFEVLSGGIMPFREEREVTSLIAEVLEQPHRSLLDVAPNVPEGLAAIVDRCLMKDRDDRYQTAADVALDLLPFAPLRSRASVERAVAAMQGAGLMATADYTRSSQPPASDRPVSGLRRGPRYSDPPPIVVEESVPSAKGRESALARDEHEDAGAIDEHDRPLRPSRARWAVPAMLAAGAALGVVSFLASSEEASRAPRDTRDGAPVSVPRKPLPGALAQTREPQKLAPEARAPTAATTPAVSSAAPLPPEPSARLTRPPATRQPAAQPRAPADVPRSPIARPPAFLPPEAKPAASQKPPEPTPEPKLDVRRER